MCPNFPLCLTDLNCHSPTTSQARTKMTLCLPFADYCPLLSFCLQLCVFPTLLEPLRLFSNLSSTAQNETLCSSQHLPTSFSLSFSPAPSSLTLFCLLCHPRVRSVLPTDDWPCHWGVTTVDSHLYSSFSSTVETSLSCDSTEQTPIVFINGKQHNGRRWF